MKIQRSIALSLTLTLIALAALACGKAGNSTPTEAFKTYYNAVKNADVAAFKSIMPKKDLEKMEKEMKEKGTNPDDTLKVLLKVMGTKMSATMPEIRNETIEGERASIEFKYEEKWEKMGFIKEDDGWKMKG